MLEIFSNNIFGYGECVILSQQDDLLLTSQMIKIAKSFRFNEQIISLPYETDMNHKE